MCSLKLYFCFFRLGSLTVISITSTFEWFGAHFTGMLQLFAQVLFYVILFLFVRSFSILGI